MRHALLRFQQRGGNAAAQSFRIMAALFINPLLCPFKTPKGVGEKFLSAVYCASGSQVEKNLGRKIFTVIFHDETVKSRRLDFT